MEEQYEKRSDRERIEQYRLRLMRDCLKDKQNIRTIRYNSYGMDGFTFKTSDFHSLHKHNQLPFKKKVNAYEKR